MAYAVTDGGFTYDDLDWLRDELGVAHLELDPWGCLIVTPASDEHDTAVAVHPRPGPPPTRLYRTGVSVSTELAWIGPRWAAGTSMCPIWSWSTRAGLGSTTSISIRRPSSSSRSASPSTRRVDRTRKLADYRLGGAGVYVLVDLPADGPPTFVAHDFADRRGHERHRRHRPGRRRASLAPRPDLGGIGLVRPTWRRRGRRCGRRSRTTWRGPGPGPAPRRPTRATWLRSHSGSGWSRLMVGGRNPSWMARIVIIASRAPAAPVRWPVIDLVDDTGTVATASPRASLRARVSAGSLSGVPVPWALT